MYGNSCQTITVSCALCLSGVEPHDGNRLIVFRNSLKISRYLKGDQLPTEGCLILNKTAFKVFVTFKRVECKPQTGRM